MNRTQITILAGAAAVGIVTAGVTVALATSATNPGPAPAAAPVEQAYAPQSFDDLSPAEQTILTWQLAWGQMTTHKQDEFCAEARVIGADTSAQVMATTARATHPDTVLVEGVLADEIRLTCNLQEN